ncbi:MAG: tagatose 1,6-diphosphate aldolase [Bryobacterales bacterium]|nr:tagatose 1,6-diphosphate aldolase [Bryobacterales bacterium]
MANYTPTEAKRKHLECVSTPEGIIAAIAMDQRRSLRRMMAGDANEETVSDAQVCEFKASITAGLSSYASAILLDSEYGLAAMAERSAGCGLLATYEADGYENPRPHRMLALMPRQSVRRLGEIGANGVKILLSWAPDDDPAANDEKRALIERIGYECDAAGLPFFLEPVVYCPLGMAPGDHEFARKKPQWVVRTMEEFSNPIYRVDVLKVEFPVGASAVGRVWQENEALEWYQAADAAARVPYIYLSAGVSISEFTGSLQLASTAGARFSGVLCGRAAWQDGIPSYRSQGAAGLLAWLSGEGARNVQAIRTCLKAATPWHHWFQEGRA